MARETFEDELFKFSQAPRSNSGLRVDRDQHCLGPYLIELKWFAATWLSEEISITVSVQRASPDQHSEASAQTNNSLYNVKLCDTFTNQCG